MFVILSISSSDDVSKRLLCFYFDHSLFSPSFPFFL